MAGHRCVSSAAIQRVQSAGVGRWVEYVSSVEMNQNKVKSVRFGQSTIMEALTIKRGQSSKSIKERLEAWVSKRKQKGINAKKHSGVIKLKKDPMEIQKAMRDEWD